MDVYLVLDSYGRIYGLYKSEEESFTRIFGLVNNLGEDSYTVHKLGVGKVFNYSILNGFGNIDIPKVYNDIGVTSTDNSNDGDVYLIINRYTLYMWGLFIDINDVYERILKLNGLDYSDVSEFQIYKVPVGDFELSILSHVSNKINYTLDLGSVDNIKRELSLNKLLDS